MNTIKFRFAVLFVFALTISWAQFGFATPQKSAAKKPQTDAREKSEGATIRGKVVQSKRGKIPFTELQTELIQQVQAPPPPVPKNFNELSLEQKQAWARKFEESEKGKAFFAEKKRLLESRHVFKVKVEEDGRFVVYDVPPGKYSLRGLTRKEIEGIDHVFEIFGALEILEDVDEQNLKPLDILVTPQLVAGNQAPDFQVNSIDNKTTLKSDDFNGKPLFVCFWSSKSPPSVSIMPKVQKLHAELASKAGLNVLSINLNDDPKAAKAFITKQELNGQHGLVKDWDHPAFEDFGVRSVPQFFLIGKDGKILMTHRDFDAQFRAGAESLEQVVSNGISGKKMPTPATRGQEPAKK